MKQLSVYLILFLFILTFYNVIIEQKMFKKVIFASIMQSSIIIYYIIVVWNVSVSSPFYNNNTNLSNYVDPVPQVLMLTAIVVGFATTALSLALVIRIQKMSIKENNINNKYNS